jgi:hypothetical protein
VKTRYSDTLGECNLKVTTDGKKLEKGSRGLLQDIFLAFACTTKDGREHFSQQSQ